LERRIIGIITSEELVLKQERRGNGFIGASKHNKTKSQGRLSVSQPGSMFGLSLGSGV